MRNDACLLSAAGKAESIPGRRLIFKSGVLSGSRAKIQAMRSPQWLSGKNNYSLAAFYIALGWGGCVLLCCGIAPPTATAVLQGSQAATVRFAGKNSPAAENDRHGVPAGPADNFPKPAVFHRCGALNSFFLRPGRKPGPSNACAPATPATGVYLYEGRERGLLSPVAMRGPVGRRDIYLHCCSFLI